jgi:hypothetical protein
MRDLEGIVAKRKFDPYLPNGETSWLKIRNPDYSRWVGRKELFEKERKGNPDLHGWECCASICAELEGKYAETQVRLTGDWNISLNRS